MKTRRGLSCYYADELPKRLRKAAKKARKELAKEGLNLHGGVYVPPVKIEDKSL